MELQPDLVLILPPSLSPFWRDIIRDFLTVRPRPPRSTKRTGGEEWRLKILEGFTLLYIGTLLNVIVSYRRKTKYLGSMPGKLFGAAAVFIDSLSFARKWCRSVEFKNARVGKMLELVHVHSSITALALISTIIRGSGNSLTPIVALAGASARVGKTLFHSSFMPT